MLGTLVLILVLANGNMLMRPATLSECGVYVDGIRAGGLPSATFQDEGEIPIVMVLCVPEAALDVPTN